METKRKQLVAGVFFTSAMIACGTLGASAANALSFRDLGSGSELRTELLETSSRFNHDQKCGAKTDSTKVESKSKEAKCGEGKCGDDKKDKKAEAKSTEAKKESKAKEAKCGEGKCGN